MGQGTSRMSTPTLKGWQTIMSLTKQDQPSLKATNKATEMIEHEVIMEINIMKKTGQEGGDSQ